PAPRGTRPLRRPGRPGRGGAVGLPGPRPVPVRRRPAAAPRGRGRDVLPDGPGRHVEGELRGRPGGAGPATRAGRAVERGGRAVRRRVAAPGRAGTAG